MKRNIKLNDVLNNTEDVKKLINEDLSKEIEEKYIQTIKNYHSRAEADTYELKPFTNIYTIEKILSTDAEELRQAHEKAELLKKIEKIIVKKGGNREKEALKHLNKCNLINLNEPWRAVYLVKWYELGACEDPIEQWENREIKTIEIDITNESITG